MRFEIPKIHGVIGAIVAVAAVVQENAPFLQQLPILQGSNTLTAVIGVAGVILALFGKPPHERKEPKGE